MKDFTEYLRELAKSNKYQTIYAIEKTIGLRLFANEYDYSDIQILFLNFLSLYYTISFDVAMGEVNKMVTNNTIFEDAYMVWRNKTKTEEAEELKERKHETQNHGRKPEKQVKTQFVFRKPRASRQ